MFYYPAVLKRHTGCFSTIWLVATKGIRVTRRDFLRVNVTRTCGDIMSYVLEQVPPPLPGLPRPRFSLYLSSQLQYGVVLVYHRQCAIFLEDLQSILGQLVKKSYPERIDMEDPSKQALLLNPDALVLLEDTEGATDPLFGTMLSQDALVSPRVLIQMGHGYWMEGSPSPPPGRRRLEPEREGSPEGPPAKAPRRATPRAATPARGDAITASPDRITLSEFQQAAIPPPEFEGEELADLPDTLDLLLAQADDFPEGEEVAPRERERRRGRDLVRERAPELPGFPLGLQFPVLPKEEELVPPLEQLIRVPVPGRVPAPVPIPEHVPLPLPLPALAPKLEPGRVPTPVPKPEPGRVPTPVPVPKLEPGRVPTPVPVPVPGHVPEPAPVPFPGDVPGTLPLQDSPDDLDLLLAQTDDFLEGDEVPAAERERRMEDPKKERAEELMASTLELQPTTLPPGHASPLPSSPLPVERERRRRRPEPESPVTSSSPEEPPRGRGRRQLIFADLETQLPQGTLEQQIGDPRAWTRPRPILPPTRHASLPAGQLLSEPCTTLLGDVLALWEDAAVIVPLKGPELQVGERGSEYTSSDRSGEAATEVPRAVKEPELLEMSEQASLPLEESRQASPLYPLEGSVVSRSVSTLQDIPEAMDEAAADVAAGPMPELAEQEEEAFLFHELLPPGADRQIVSSTFQRLLDNLSLRRYRAQQDEPYGDILIVPETGLEAAATS